MNIEETEKLLRSKLSKPLTKARLGHVQYFALPSTMIALASAATFGVSSVVLMRDAQVREYFTSPIPGWVAGAAATLIVVVTLLWVQGRPTNLWSNTWGLFLGLIAAGAALTSAVASHGPAHAVALASLLAALAYGARLFRGHPMRRTMYWVAPLAFLVTVVSLGVSAWAKQTALRPYEQAAAGVDRRLTALEARIDHALATDWSRLASMTPEQADEQLRPLSELRSACCEGLLEPVSEDGGAVSWSDLQRLGLSGPLLAHYERVLGKATCLLTGGDCAATLDGVAGTFATPQLDRVVTIHEDRPGIWERGSGLAGASAAVARHHELAWEVLGQLGSPESGFTQIPPQVGFESARREALDAIAHGVGTRSTQFGKDWVFALIECPGSPGGEGATWRGQLEVPMIDGIAAGELVTLLDLDWEAAQTRASASPNCEVTNYDVAGGRNRQIACVSYWGVRDDNGARAYPRLLVRLDWQGDAPRPVGAYFVAATRPGESDTAALKTRDAFLEGLRDAAQYTFGASFDGATTSSQNLHRGFRLAYGPRGEARPIVTVIPVERVKGKLTEPEGLPPTQTTFEYHAMMSR